ncbi:MAG: putative small conductance mechanosensitive ion [Ramlibacter sp.]|jgi:small-conductance mechanosensitive channel|uniref:mechanosensitive ion channel family protein n=1 Tax=Ramlibacter sp. TaxID=1917967 RepID=UPI0026258E48|nr:mechanosensitive ion channel family protein [Ramlibacter sp.]MDB5751531.1 putative small conductance mechanosensitive ion [Ramlibacter sp.]
MIQLLQQNPWVATALLALAAVMGAMVAHRLLRAVLRQVMRGSLLFQSMLTATERAGSAVLPLLALMLVWQAAPNDLLFIGIVRHLTGLLLIGAITWWVLSFINGLSEGLIARHPSSVEDNLNARRIQTQTKVLSRSAMVVVVIAGIAMALMTFPGARQVGASLLASAGVLGIVGGLAARPVFSNLIAGLQLALAQPIRLDDVLIVKGEWGRVEEITGTYVVLKIWDERRLIIPLQWFIENPFENWTRTGSQLLGTAFLYLDFGAPVDAIRAEAKRITEEAPEWDKRVFGVQVTDTTERTMQVRILVSAANSGAAFDLRCKLREGLLAFLAREYPQSLPKVRGEEPAEMRPEAAASAGA